MERMIAFLQMVSAALVLVSVIVSAVWWAVQGVIESLWGWVFVISITLLMAALVRQFYIEWRTTFDD